MKIHKADVLEHLNELFNDTLNISREVRKLDMPEKEIEQTLKNFQKIGGNILVAIKRVSKDI